MLLELPLVGRQTELAFLSERIQGTSGGVILLAGEAGIGKSRLVNHVLAEAGRFGRPAALGACPGLSLHTGGSPPVLLGEARPFGPWRDAVNMFGQITGEALEALPPPFGSGPRALTHYDLALDVANFLGTSRERGGAPILVLEDIHWADTASLEMLQHASSRFAYSPVLIIATYRTDEVHREHPLHALIPSLLRSGAQRVALQRLSYDDVAELARHAGRAHAAVEIYNRSGGNPFFVTQLLTSSGETLPDTVQQAIDGRLSRLTSGALEILRVAAVLGESFRFETLLRTLEEPEETVLEALEEALQLHLLREQGERFAFDHALVREVLYAGMIGPRRQVWHRRAARAARDPDVIAYHLGQAGDSAAVPYLKEAGDRALQLGAHAHGASFYERALALSDQGENGPERAELILLAAFAGTGADFERAGERTEEALRAAVAAGDAVVAGLARRHLATLLHERKQEQAIAVMEEAHSELAALFHQPRLHQLHERMYGRPLVRPGAPEALASVYLWAGRPADAEALLADASTAGTVEHHVLGLCALVRGDLDSGCNHFRQSVEAAIAARQYADAADRLVNLTHTLLYQRGDQHHVIDPLMALLEQTWRQARDRSGVDPFGGRSPLMDTWVWRGRWDRARREADAADRLEPRPGDRLIAHHNWLCTVLDTEQGNFAEARRRAAPRLPPGGPGSPPPYGYYIARIYLMTTVARACRMAGDLEEARAWLETVDAWHRGARPSLYNYALNLVEWAEYHRAVGDLPAARRAAEGLLKHGTAMRSTRLLMEGHRFLGALGVGDTAQHFATALALAEAAGYRYEAARVRLERGTAADLASARETFERLGARPALAQAEAALARLSSARTPAPGGLTERERAVVRLVARGLTDREIGAQLHISPRTVGGHLGNIFAKLNLTSRSALVAWALRHGVEE
ncbi:MAG: helix-turn-helix transcriptional regulator [Bacillota bacterium]